MNDSYTFREIEPRWQREWEAARVFRAANPGEPGAEKPKFYVLDFFPYPSGAGLHVGHPLGYIASDIIARYMRMRGFNVLHPMGWDAFGLPAEQYAVETNVHPRITTQKNIETYKRQLAMIGLGYDWSRELATCDPKYYRWTQWIFLQIYNSWYDPECEWVDSQGRKVRGRARPIADLPVPPDVAEQGAAAIEAFRDDHRLAFRAEVPVNWCPALGTVLANEEVTADGRSDRGNHPVFRRPMKQWMLRITDYADRLLADLDGLEWPEAIKLAQRNWIGRSEGAYVDFPLESDPANLIRVYTTRPDTLFGATYLVLAPEHRLVSVVTTADKRAAVDAYVSAAAQKSERARTAETKEKTGVFTGAYATNPVNGRRVPIWVADYVLGGYGTGSIMAVPGSDKRDLEFADAFGLEVIQVVQPTDDSSWRGYEEHGIAVNSPPDGAGGADVCDLNGLPTPEAKRKITCWLEEQGRGEGTVQYKLRDWLFSRQRYWGEPFPILFGEDGLAAAEAEENLPVRLPDMDDFRPEASDDPNAEPKTPLSRAAEWTSVERDGRRWTRELNTMPQWAGSCWYYLRFADAGNENAFIDAPVEQYWFGGSSTDGAARPGGVDLYMGGAEHAVLHLLYARFWHKVLYDLGHVSTPEPFQKLFNQGMIQSYAFERRDGIKLARDRVLRLVGGGEADCSVGPIREDEPSSPEAVHRWENGGKPLTPDAVQQLLGTGEALIDAETGQPVVEIVAKMSKSLRNVINPDAIIEEYGADTMRLYEMSMGPLDDPKPWNTRAILGPHRFLQRVWRLVVGGESDESGRSVARIVDTRNAELERLLHKTIAKVGGDIERFAFNTAIPQMIVWVNEVQKAEAVGRDQIERFLRILAPFAPHIAEELWSRMGGEGLICRQEWPSYDPALTVDATVEMLVQVNGKRRGRIEVATDASDEEVVQEATKLEAVSGDLRGKPPKRAIVAKGRLVNLII